jgi:hypothetical protein
VVSPAPPRRKHPMNEVNRKADTALMSRDQEAALLERVVVGGDLSKLTPVERVQYYRAVCESVGLNPRTRPFEYLYLQNKMTLYARKEATEQLREIHGVRITKLDPRLISDQNEDFYEVTAYGVNAKGREDADIGVVCLSGAHGEQRANLKMKATTKAKRRLTLSLCGLGMLDESEVEIPAGAQRVTEVVEGSVTYMPDGKAKAEAGAEVSTLFPTPEADRAGLIQRARVAASRLDKERVRKMKADALGSADAKYEDVDLAALVSFVNAVEEVRL